MRPRGRDVECLDLRTLIGGSGLIAERIGSSNVEIIKRVGSLKPGTRETQVQLHGIDVGQFEVHAIENVLLVALVVHHLEFGWIEKTSAVEAADGNVVPSFVAAIGEIEAGVRAAKSSIRGEDTPVWLLHSHSGTSRHLDHHTGLVAEFGRRGSGNDFQGLNRIERNLIGKLLALLICDRLTVNRE